MITTMHNMPSSRRAWLVTAVFGAVSALLGGCGHSVHSRSREIRGEFANIARSSGYEPLPYPQKGFALGSIRFAEDHSVSVPAPDKLPMAEKISHRAPLITDVDTRSWNVALEAGKDVFAQLARSGVRIASLNPGKLESISLDVEGLLDPETRAATNLTYQRALRDLQSTPDADGFLVTGILQMSGGSVTISRGSLTEADFKALLSGLAITASVQSQDAGTARLDIPAEDAYVIGFKRAKAMQVRKLQKIDPVAIIQAPVRNVDFPNMRGIGDNNWSGGDPFARDVFFELREHHADKRLDVVGHLRVWIHETDRHAPSNFLDSQLDDSRDFPILTVSDVKSYARLEPTQTRSSINGELSINDFRVDAGGQTNKTTATNRGPVANWNWFIKDQNRVRIELSPIRYLVTYNQ